MKLEDVIHLSDEQLNLLTAELLGFQYWQSETMDIIRKDNNFFWIPAEDFTDAFDVLKYFTDVLHRKDFLENLTAIIHVETGHQAIFPYALFNLEAKYICMAALMVEV